VNRHTRDRYRKKSGNALAIRKQPGFHLTHCNMEA
jgi:hypothetical protein